MKIRQVAVALIISIGIGLFISPVSRATEPGVMISQLQTGGIGSGTADQEFVEIYNGSSTDIDVTGWCVKYTSASDGTVHMLGCVVAPNTTTHIWLKAHGYFTLASSAYQTAAKVTADLTMSYTGIAATGGHVRLLDMTSVERDKVGWGAATNPETAVALAPADGTSIIRALLQDTDNNAVDFTNNATPTIHIDGLYDVETVIDVCANIDGVQSILPKGYEVDNHGDCYVDMCSNIGGLQIVMPEGKVSDGVGGCIDIDVCSNISGTQASLPAGYRFATDETTCLLDMAPLQITELLADASGSDTGNEFVELYNPGMTAVDLTNYRLQVGPALEKSYVFPAGTSVPAGGYAVFYNSAIRFTLVNTTSRVGLISTDGQMIDQVPTYTNPPEAESWASVSGTWQYTNQPTPAAANQASIIDTTDTGDVTVSPVSVLKPCDAGQYRNPATGRCKKIEVSNGLTPCKDGQYRSEETGRCRSIATAAASVLKPCADNEFRNPETNRCKKIASTEDVLQPCDAGYERNPETNRCRKAVANATVPEVPFAVAATTDGAKAFTAWWALGGIGVVAVGYGAWEWRHEARRAMKRASTFLSSRK